MVNKNILSLTIFALLFSLAFASAAYYSSQILSTNDIYWASDYYSSGLYHENKIQSQQQIHTNHQTLPKNYPYYYNQHYESHSTQPRTISHRGISANYVYYSPTIDKYTIKKCHIVPPSNQLFYVKC